MWITPKTDWNYDDFFNLHPDYFRIKNNILELQRLLSRTYGSFHVIGMRDYGMGEGDFVDFADFFNHVERNVDLLADNGFRNPALPSTSTWVVNKAAWDYHDLNRIEGSLAMLRKDLLSQTYSMRNMEFLMGGEDFE